MMQGVYKIENRENKKAYIGSSVNIEKRMKGHRNKLRKGKHHSIYLQHAWDKYGEDMFDFRVVETVKDAALLLAAEQKHLDGRFALGACYNTARNATAPMLGHTHTNETRRKMSKAAMGNQRCLGYKHTDEAKRKMSIAQRGRKHTEETKLKMGMAQKGRTVSDETRAKIGVAATGRKPSEETRRKLSRARLGNQNAKGSKRTDEWCREKNRRLMGELNPMWGKQHTDETKRKQSAATKRWWANKRREAGG